MPSLPGTAGSKPSRSRLSLSSMPPSRRSPGSAARKEQGCHADATRTPRTKTVRQALIQFRLLVIGETPKGCMAAVKALHRGPGTAMDSLALPRLEPAVGLVDDVEASPPPHHAVVAMALAQGPERILDLHAKHPTTMEERQAPRAKATRIKGSRADHRKGREPCQRPRAPQLPLRASRAPPSFSSLFGGRISWRVSAC